MVKTNIDCIEISNSLLKRAQSKIKLVQNKISFDINPKFACILVGDNSASKIYVNKMNN